MHLLVLGSGEIHKSIRKTDLLYDGFLRHRVRERRVEQDLICEAGGILCSNVLRKLRTEDDHIVYMCGHVRGLACLPHAGKQAGAQRRWQHGAGYPTTSADGPCEPRGSMRAGAASDKWRAAGGRAGGWHRPRGASGDLPGRIPSRA